MLLKKTSTPTKPPSKNEVDQIKPKGKVNNNAKDSIAYEEIN